MAFVEVLEREHLEGVVSKRVPIPFVTVGFLAVHAAPRRGSLAARSFSHSSPNSVTGTSPTLG